MNGHTTYWHYAVKANGRELLISGNATLAEAIQNAITSAIYYQAIEPGSRITIEEIAEICSTCYNNGTVKNHVRRSASGKQDRFPGAIKRWRGSEKGETK